MRGARLPDSALPYGAPVCEIPGGSLLCSRLEAGIAGPFLGFGRETPPGTVTVWDSLSLAPGGHWGDSGKGPFLGIPKKGGFSRRVKKRMSSSDFHQSNRFRARSPPEFSADDAQYPLAHHLGHRSRLSKDAGIARHAGSQLGRFILEAAAKTAPCFHMSVHSRILCAL